MAKSKSSEIEYHRQGSIDDENFIYLFNKIENLESTTYECLVSLKTELQNELSSLISVVEHVYTNISAQTTELKTDLGEIATAINNLKE